MAIVNLDLTAEMICVIVISSNYQRCAMTDMQKFRALQREIHAHAHVLNLLYLDAVTAAPSDTAAERGETLEH